MEVCTEVPEVIVGASLAAHSAAAALGLANWGTAETRGGEMAKVSGAVDEVE